MPWISIHLKKRERDEHHNRIKHFPTKFKQLIGVQGKNHNTKKMKSICFCKYTHITHKK